MKLFSGDQNGVVVLTEIDYYMVRTVLVLVSSFHSLKLKSVLALLFVFYSTLANL